jgi:hypothetical protein
LAVDAWHWGSAVFATTLEHVPAPFRLHAWHFEQEEVEQQTPLVQYPLPHSVPDAQVAPWGLAVAQTVPLQP